jgi:hypothetical protein
LGDVVHTPVEILLQLGTSVGASFGCSMEFIGLLQELLGPHVEPTDYSLLFLEHLLHLLQVLTLLRRLQLLGLEA